MASVWSFPPLSSLHGILSLIFLLFPSTTAAMANAVSPTTRIVQKPTPDPPLFRQASPFSNGESCPPPQSPNKTIHIAMTLDANYLRGTMAAVLSILEHSTCPENITFHFLWSRNNPFIISAINSRFPYLNFKLYRFNSSRVNGRISKSIRQALDQPLNYARIYLAELLPLDVERAIYLDSDLVLVDDVAKIWTVAMGDKPVAAPEYCHANFTNYFTEEFWSNPILSKTFEGRKPCYFNTGVMLVDVGRWRRGGYTKMVEEWMELQKKKRIFHLGSLPPFLLVFAGNIKAIDHRWNQHGLGGDNLEGKCRSLHPGPVSLLHWSGKGKPWLRLDARKPCAVDYLWAPYDLYHSSARSLEQ
ncbi:hypothetical protein Nepgr_004471 [Nepenthes gracilis]|uniref:Hexosyltransferase n=1 Tax=Nepenthes gracilis TaxID=150966 RepID=A0AAD3S1N7_NEPGR|nr:hypothetical protein Nepgr_004471 [Nepenthes gracilis]